METWILVKTVSRKLHGLYAKSYGYLAKDCHFPQWQQKHVCELKRGNCFSYFIFFKRQPNKIIKHTKTIRQLLPTDCSSVFDHFVRLSLKGLIMLAKNVNMG